MEEVPGKRPSKRKTTMCAGMVFYYQVDVRSGNLQTEIPIIYKKISMG